MEAILDRYRQIDTATPQYLEKLSKSLMKAADLYGLTDASVKLSYDEFEVTQLKVLSGEGANLASPQDKMQFAKDVLLDMFSSLNMNGHGIITFNEWSAHYHCMGIDTAHARASFDAMDVNGDGKVTEKMFVNYHYEYYYTTENTLNSGILYGPL